MEGKIVVTVTGADKVGIVAGVTAKLQELKGNVADITQTVLDGGIFAMIMLIDASGTDVDFTTFKNELINLEESLGIKVFVQHEDVFHAMHRI